MKHQPVLLNETLQYLDLQPGQVIVDGTFGFGGHAAAIAAKIGKDGYLIGIEQDPRTLKANQNIQDAIRCQTKLSLINANFSELREVLDRLKIDAVDAILLDLGISSFQLAEDGYGLSWQRPMPLDMRLSGAGRTAGDILRQSSEKELADMLYELADETKSRRIARAIKDHIKEIKTTADLGQVIASVVPQRGKIHPATKTFMALRMAANDELEHLEKFLKDVPQLLCQGGRLVIISFHSGEDRLVKRAFKDKQVWQALTSKPVVAQAGETQQNPRSRSAKLRAATTGS